MKQKMFTQYLKMCKLDNYAWAHFADIKTDNSLEQEIKDFIIDLYPKHATLSLFNVANLLYHWEEMHKRTK